MTVRYLSAPLLLAAAASCAVPAPSPVPLDALGVGLACRGNGDGARTGMTFGYWGSGYRGWGNYAKVRVDVATGAAFFVGNADDDAYEEEDDPYIDDYTGAIAIDAGLVYRFADAFAVYGGAGFGYLYELDSEVDAYGNVDRDTNSLDWAPAASAGLLWLWGDTGMGLDVGYDTFDRSYRLGIIYNFAGMSGGESD